jgi:hypothetical protein
MAKFEKGHAGGPGRPKGARNKLQEAFWKDFAATWEAHGQSALEKVAQDDPSTFVRVAASVMPKEIEATVEHRSVMRMPEPAATTEEWMEKYGRPTAEKRH